MPTRGESGAQRAPGDDAAEAAAPASNENAPKDESSNEDSGSKKKYITHWTCSKLQGDDNDHSGFGFPTLTPNTPVELGPRQYEKANAAAILATGYRLREWEANN